MTQMQPDVPEDSLVHTEGVNAGSADELRDEGGDSGDLMAGGDPVAGGDASEQAEEPRPAGELAGAPGTSDLDTGQDQAEPGQDVGLLDTD